MLKLKDIAIVNNIISMVVLIEGDANRAYKLKLDKNTEWLSVIETEIPEEYKIYERQASMALLEYKGGTFPSETTSMWG